MCVCVCVCDLYLTFLAPLLSFSSFYYTCLFPLPFVSSPSFVRCLFISQPQDARSDSFKDYQRQVLSNASTLASSLQGRGFELVSGGTDNHLVLVNTKVRDR